MANERFGTKPLSPPEVARQTGISELRVRKLIEAGRLKATDVGVGSKNPRWKIMPEHLAEFFGVDREVARA
ncbi:hypothetical protein [Rosistilla oblonga]|uniref:hypothetical protein n=1 Tax=Rosistilla oblonga TaxID=2527990 RepID=UPI003A985D07